MKIKNFYYKFKNCFKIFIIFILLSNITTNVFAFDESLNSNLLILVNDKNLISREYIPQNLYNIGDFMPITKNKVLVREEVYNSLKLMYQDLKECGLELNGVSGYRNYEYQENLFNNEVTTYKNLDYTEEEAKDIAKSMVALPGSSEHQTGLAIDFSTNFFLSEEFGLEEVGLWLKENCKNYGFILRYPEDKTDITNIIHEPWHFRFVGLPHSLYITENNLTLEEYIDLLKSQQHIFKIYNDIRYDIYYTNNSDDEFDRIIDISYTNSGGYIITTEFYIGSLLLRTKEAFIEKGAII